MSVGIVAIRENPECIRWGCVVKGYDPSMVDEALALDAACRVRRAEEEAARAERNRLSRRYAELTRELNDLLARFETWLT